MKRIWVFIIMLQLVTSMSLSWAKDADIGTNFHFEEVKKKQRSIASEHKVVRPNIDAIEAEDEKDEENNDRSVASEVEKESSTPDIKYWKFTP